MGIGHILRLQHSCRCLLQCLPLADRGRLCAASKQYGKLWTVLLPNRQSNHVAGFGLSASANRRDQQERGEMARRAELRERRRREDASSAALRREWEERQSNSMASSAADELGLGLTDDDAW